jgi:hypothetical protein
MKFLKAIVILSGTYALLSCKSEVHKEDYRATLPDTLRFSISHEQDHLFWQQAVQYVNNTVTNGQQVGVRADEVWVDADANGQGHSVYLKRFNSRDFVNYEMVWKYNGSIQNLSLIKEKIEKKAK